MNKKIMAAMLIAFLAAIAFVGPAHAGGKCSDISQCCPPGALCYPYPQ